MTVSEKLERMRRCDNCVNGECLLDGFLPFDCGYCTDFVDSLGDSNDEADTSVDYENVKIYVPDCELWDFYVENRERCDNEMVLIAENTETAYAVYLTCDNEVPMLSVCKGDGQPEYEECVLSRDDCTKAARKLFFRYLFPVTIIDGKETSSEDEVQSREDIEDEIYVREDELQFALKDFLDVVVHERAYETTYNPISDELIETALEHFLEYLANEHGLEIYRPMFVLDEETGIETYVQFPYEFDNIEDESE